MSARRILLALSIALAYSAATSAHRLDEYLQAATIAVEQQEVTVRLVLTPGVSVAAAVLASIDTDHDRTISTREQRRYAERERDGLLLTIDGRPTALALRSWTFAPLAAMRSGAGDIILVLVAALPAGTTHQIALDHRQHDDGAIYLANALMPADRGIRIVAQQRSYDQSHYRLYVEPGSRAPDGAAAPTSSSPSSSAPVVATFFAQGLRHILTGYDHLLFVAALALGAMSLWDLVKVVTAFTIAHSVTLTLAAFRLVHLPEALVEPMIAISIVAVAVQNVVKPDRAQSGSRLTLAFLFGLFHGLGFAGGLLEVMHGLSNHVVLLAIFGFSLGVEAGSQVVLLPLFGVLRAVTWHIGVFQAWGSSVRQVGSIAVAGVGMIYLVIAVAAALSQTLPDRLIEQVTPLSAINRWNCSLVYWLPWSE